MIKLTFNGVNVPMMIDPAKIALIETDGSGGSYLYDSFNRSDGWEVRVKESPEEVTKKILEYKLAMVKYSVGFAQALRDSGDPEWVFDNAEFKMSELAGLEEPQ
ncbi:hypothetical protein [Paenibacillus pinihumi]|uniref:hypothetical protein n=1 Tax=Paenibacillus pinihumi TaxID=669462 RepID=UPI00048D1353|nr:hypothetical protein [Paenibacillus pinihumi]